MHLRSALNFRLKINQDAPVVISAVQPFEFNRCVGITAMKLIGLEALREVLLPNLRERPVWINNLRFFWGGLVFIIEILPNRLHHRSKTSMDFYPHAHCTCLVIQDRL